MVIGEKLSSINIEQIPHIHLLKDPKTMTEHPELQPGEYLELLIPRQAVDKRVAEIALAIKRDCESLGPENVLFVPIEKGGGRFLELVQKEIQDTITEKRIQRMRIKSYFGAKSTGDLQFLPPFLNPEKLHGKDVFIFEDIYDTGLTLQGAIEKVKEGKPASISIAVLLDKQEVLGKIPVPEITYCCFIIDNEFVVGASCLDHMIKENGKEVERFRDLKDLWVLAGAT